MPITDDQIRDLVAMLENAPEGVGRDIVRLVLAAADPALAPIARRAAAALRNRDASQLEIALRQLDEQQLAPDQNK